MYFSHMFVSVLIATDTVIAQCGTNLTALLPGSDACNNARAKIVNALIKTSKSAVQIQDSAVKQDTMAGLTKAQAAIEQIGQALLADNTPPATGRAEVQAGLVAAGQALAAGNITERAVIRAQRTLQQAVQAGGDVVALC